MLALCRQNRLPLPEVNGHAEENEVDFLWRGRTARGGPSSATASATRTRLAGWRVVRITHDRLKREPQTIARQLRSLLWA